MWRLVIFVLAIAGTGQVPRDAVPTSQQRPATISGRVVDDTGRPIAAAAVIATTAGAPGARTALTDTDGRFVVEGVSPGRVRLSAKRPGYPRVEFGQLNPSDAGTVIVLAAGQRFEAPMVMPRGAVITGKVITETGDTAANAGITVFRWSAAPFERRMVFVANATADGRGIFRAFGLPAGEYVVAPGWPARLTVAPPGSASVTLAAGEERDADVRPPDAPSSFGRVSGTALALDGRPVRFTNIQLVAADNRSPVTANTDTGAFLLRSVPVGTYTIVARATAGREPIWAFADVRVEPNESTEVAMTLKPGTTLTGSISMDLSTRAADSSRVSVHLVPTHLPEYVLSGNFRLERTGASFVITGIAPGSYTVRVSGPAELAQWTVKATLKNVDLIETPLTIGDEPLSGVVVGVSDRSALVEGRVRDSTGAAASQIAVVVFSSDRRHWHSGSRRLAIARPDTEGAFSVGGLPAGTYYAAVTTQLPMSWQQPSFIERLSRTATVTLREGERVTLDLDSRH